MCPDEAFAAAVEQAKLEAIYDFAYGLSHEINNQLANIATRAQTLLAGEKDPERRRALATINQQAFRAHEMLADLMLFARPPSIKPEEVELVALADSVISELQPRAAEQGATLARAAETAACVAFADPVHLGLALRALVQNALDAIGGSGSVTVSVSQNLQSEINHPQLSVSDTGPGISPEMRTHIFNPFYCGREAGRGLGIGLSKVWRIAQLHGGSVEVVSEPGRGATFTIRLPARGA